MRNIFLTAFVLFTSLNFCYSQELELISTSGASTTSAGGSVSWSVGEVVIATATNGSSNVPQGFHQSNIWILGAEELVQLEISIFPNPTCEYVNITAPQDAVLSIYDMEGRLVSTHVLINTTTMIDVSSYSRGMYNLVFSTKDSDTRTAKLIVQ